MLRQRRCNTKSTTKTHVEPCDMSQHVQVFCIAHCSTVYGIVCKCPQLCDCADNGVKFEGQSAYDSDFHAHPLERRAPMNPVPAARNTAKFDGTSTYHVSQTSLLAVCPRAFAPASRLHCHPSSPIFTIECLNHTAQWWSLMMIAMHHCF